MALLPRAVDGNLKDALGGLREAMQAPHPARAEVIKRTGEFLRRLKGWPERLANRPAARHADLRERFEDLLKSERASASSWDALTQTYLALAAHHHALSDLEGPAGITPRWREELRSLARQLRLPETFNPDRGRKEK
jgi:hypothetical protein